MRYIVAEELRRFARGIWSEIVFWIFLGACLVVPLWYSMSKDDTSFSYCPAEEPKSSKKVSKEDIDKVMYVFEKVKDIQKTEKAEEKPIEYTIKKIGETKEEDLDTYLARHSNCSDAVVEEKVERILTKRAKSEDAEA